MAGHPEIEAARSKIAMAESELRQVQFRVARELMELRAAWTVLAANFEGMKETNRKHPGAIPQTDMIEKQAQLAELEAKANALLSRKPFATPAPYTSSSSAKLKPPRGPIVEQMRRVLNEPTTVDFIDMPLSDAIVYLKDKHKVEMQVVDSGQNQCGFESDEPINLNLASLPFGALLQAIEDATGNVRFVLRDYAIVAVPKDSPLATSAVSAVEFWEQSLPEEQKGDGEKK